MNLTVVGPAYCHKTVSRSSPVPVYVVADKRRGTRSHRRSGSQQAKPTPRKKAVLIFSGMHELALYRAELLHQVGMAVTVPESFAEAVQAIKSGSLDLVVIAYTLSNETVHQVAEIVRNHCPGCRLLAVARHGGIDPKIAPDEIVNAEEGPRAFVAAVRRLLDQS